MSVESNSQQAPYPHALAALVRSMQYKPNYRIELKTIDRGQGSAGLTLIITTHEPDSYHPKTWLRVDHYFPVPPAAYDLRSWQRWLLDRCLDVAAHETCEFFMIDGKRPYAPSHGPGNDPYLIRELGTELDQRTRFTGEVAPHVNGRST